MYLGSDAGYGDAYRYLRPAPCRVGPVIDIHPGGRARRDPGSEETSPSPRLTAGPRKIESTGPTKVDIEGGEYQMSSAREFLARSEKIVIMFESEQDWCERAGYRQEDALLCFAR